MCIRDRVKTAAGLTKTMAPRREDTIVKEDLPKVSGDIADFHRNVVAVIRDGWGSCMFPILKDTVLYLDMKLLKF